MSYVLSMINSRLINYHDVIQAIHIMHKAGFIHRDIKPANMAPGYKNRKMIYLFDFGLARFIFNDKEKKVLRPARKVVSDRHF